MGGDDSHRDSLLHLQFSNPLWGISLAQPAGVLPAGFCYVGVVRRVLREAIRSAMGGNGNPETTLRTRTVLCLYPPMSLFEWLEDVFMPWHSRIAG